MAAAGVKYFSNGTRVRLIRPARDARKRVLAAAGEIGEVVYTFGSKDPVYAVLLDRWGDGLAHTKGVVTVGVNDVVQAIG